MIHFYRIDPIFRVYLLFIYWLHGLEIYRIGANNRCYLDNLSSSYILAIHYAIHCAILYISVYQAIQMTKIQCAYRINENIVSILKEQSLAKNISITDIVEAALSQYLGIIPNESNKSVIQPVIQSDIQLNERIAELVNERIAQCITDVKQESIEAIGIYANGLNDALSQRDKEIDNLKLRIDELDSSEAIAELAEVNKSLGEIAVSTALNNALVSNKKKSALIVVRSAYKKLFPDSLITIEDTAKVLEKE